MASNIEIQEEDDNDEEDDEVNYANVETKTKTARHKHPRKTRSVRRRRRYRLVWLGFGLLCVVQALLNIGLRLSLYSNLTKDLDIVTAERDELKRRLSLCESLGWQVFDRHDYYISTESKTWDESNKWCKDKQSHMIIINSKEEQDFVNSVLNKGQGVWLGLTDREEDGVWKWVDGTPLTSPTYWDYGEPSNNGLEEREDCAEHYNSDRLTGWNDVACTTTLRWICEKVVL